jgi:hypothetical protein
MIQFKKTEKPRKRTITLGYDGKYGRVSTEHGDIPDDEPVIVFRARDVNTRAVLAHYLKLCDQGSSPVRHLRLIAEALHRFTGWQEKNPDKVRVPGSEGSRQWRRD